MPACEGFRLSVSNVCPACGAVNAPTNRFCVNCGTRLAAPAAAVPIVPPPAYPPAAPVPYPTYPGAYPYVVAPPRRANASNFLSGMFDVWAKNFVAFFLVYLILGIVLAVLNAALSFAFFRDIGGFSAIPGTTTVSSTDLVALALYAIAAVVLGAILAAAVTGGMTEFAVRRSRGESMSIEQAMRRGIEKFLSVLGANVLLTLIILGLLILPVVLLIPLVLFGATSPGGALAAIGALCLVLVVGGGLALYLAVAMALYAPAIMMENATAVGSLSRSWRMTKGHWWSLFGAFIVAGILVLLIAGGIAALAGLAGNRAVSVVASTLANAIVLPLFVILAAVAYDLIVREPTFLFGAAPPYPSGPIAPPPGAAQAPPPPPMPPPPAP